MKKGFTLSEVMIALTVLGVLCVTVLPAIVSTMPSQKKIMIKRAYYTTANLVSDLINDPDLYPSVNSDKISGAFCRTTEYRRRYYNRL